MGIQIKQFAIITLFVSLAWHVSGQSEFWERPLGFVEEGGGFALNLESKGKDDARYMGVSRAFIIQPIRFSTQIGKYAGVSFAYKYANFSLETERIVHHYSTTFPNLNWVAGADHWTLSQLEAGGYVNLPIKRWFLMAECMIGKGTMRVPATEIYAFKADYPVMIVRKESRKTYNFITPAVSARYRLADRLNLFATVGFQCLFKDEIYSFYYSNPDYISDFVSSSFKEYSILYPRYQNINYLLEIKTGLGYTLFRSDW